MPAADAVPETGPQRPRGVVRPAAVLLLAVSIGLLVLVGVTGPNAASPDLGPRGWAPGSLPGGFGPLATTVLLDTAYVLGGLGVAAALLGRLRLRLSWWPVGGLAVVALLTTPFGSADHLNYVAYGRILVQGGDPYTQAPLAWHGGHDPVTSHVEPPWTRTPSIYGPFATLLQALSAYLGGNTLRQEVWVWQVLVVASWLLARHLLRDLVADHGRVDLLWTVNPLVLGPGVLGAHVDVVATALVLLALRLAENHPLLTGGALGLAATTKITYAVPAAAVVGVWGVVRTSTVARRVGALVVGLLVVLVPLHLLLGRHVYDQLERARRSVSLATPGRLLVDVLQDHLARHTVRSVVFVLAAVVAVLLAWALARATNDLAPATVPGQTMRWTFVLSTAYTLAAPYSLPWYDALTWATLPALAASGVDLVLLGRATVMAVAYVPGRVVGMTPGVERATMWVRRSLTPWVGLAAWLALAALGRRGGPVRRASRSARDGRP